MSGSRPSTKYSARWQCVGGEGAYTNTATQPTSPIIISSHVDDLIGIAPTENDLDDAERTVETRVELDKRGRRSNVKLHWSKGQVILTQKRLIESMVQQFLDGKAGGRHSLPLNPDAYQKPDPWNERAQVQNEPPPRYQSMVGSLLFMTRPEISIYVSLMERRTKDTTQTHWKTALQVLWYLASTPSEGLAMRKAEDLCLTVYTGVAYGGESARSQTGAMLCLGKQLVGWTRSRYR